MNRDDTVSVIVPVYQAEEYLETCVDSLLKQTWPDFEVILVDDGSTDGSGEVIAARYGQERRVRYYKKENGGVSSARNEGLRLAEGTYVSFVDADDWVAPCFLEDAMRCLRREKLDLVLGGTRKVYPDHEEAWCADGRKRLWVYEGEGIQPVIRKLLSNGTKPPELRKCFTSGVVCRVFRREILEGLTFRNDLVIGEDTVFNLDAMKHVRRMGVSTGVWYYYRMHGTSATMRRRPTIREDTKRLMACLYEQYSADAGCRDDLAVRGIQQFYEMLLLDVMHEESLLSHRQQRRRVRQCLEEKLWMDVFALSSAGKIPTGIPDKLLFWFAKRQCPWGVWSLVRMRRQAKRIRNRIRSR